ncbi:NS3 [Umatilla virus]|uniref:NS3 n=1 Tax=Umatilla virus TaxID=40060 RepID=G8DP11_9REOV|nr:NS3 [Umatilla virus]AEE98377.1 NS3 [Umatilla virus]
MLEAAERAQERSKATESETVREDSDNDSMSKGLLTETVLRDTKRGLGRPVTQLTFVDELSGGQGFMYQQLQDKAQALNILTNAVTSTTGANDTLKNEKAVFGATSDALKDDPFTRYTKQLAYETTISQILGQMATKRRKMLILDVVKYMLGIILLMLLLWNMIVESIEEESYKEVLSGMFGKNNNDTQALFSAARAIRRYTSYLEMISSIAMTFVVRKIMQLGVKLKALERDKIKREAYNKTVARVSHSGICSPSAPTLESTER